MPPLQVLSAQEWASWGGKYRRAAAAMDGREAGVAALAEELEAGLELLGVTAIEDKLQVGVGEGSSVLN